MIDPDNIIAIDVHTHAEVSCRQPHDDYRPELDEAFVRYFKSGQRPTIQETADYYRERKMAFVMFTVDSEFAVGKRRIPNEEVAEAAKENRDVMIPFASIDPH
ncbi:MAG: 4-hydroxyphenyl-beta-ketoacyl-CoA hydrolase, partial [Lewinella sp.]|nr:4-hydroxyphenyl-beta-ketoacyl-CoA hydrolase [Lewinella sp.]